MKAGRAGADLGIGAALGQLIAPLRPDGFRLGSTFRHGFERQQIAAAERQPRLHIVSGGATDQIGGKERADLHFPAGRKLKGALLRCLGDTVAQTHEATAEESALVKEIARPLSVSSPTPRKVTVCSITPTPWMGSL